MLIEIINTINNLNVKLILVSSLYEKLQTSNNNFDP